MRKERVKDGDGGKFMAREQHDKGSVLQALCPGSPALSLPHLLLGTSSSNPNGGNKLCLSRSAPKGHHHATLCWEMR